jgi:uncharacterized membrane protein
MDMGKPAAVETGLSAVKRALEWLCMIVLAVLVLLPLCLTFWLYRHSHRRRPSAH